MLKDIEDKDVSVGDNIIYCDNRGVCKGKVTKLTSLTLTVENYDLPPNHNSLHGSLHTIRLNGDNGRYIYKIC